ncbi:MAG: hypothetical protein HYT85_13640 [candidate division NC10 bacterium]|nr:hypothetical protein [candidate division NC10 bacterium]MBI2457642.1 hypothetical protein [candidate division NC10 bacterium]MBI2561546.1 hypothetical protein [candidate division NC10 bacterium]
MRLTKVPRYSATELERRAETLLRDRYGWPPTIPVDIESLVDQEPGLLLDILPGLQELCGVAGLARYEPDTDTMRIIIDAKEWPLRITQKVERAMRERLAFLE